MAARPKLLFFVTEDWYFCSHRLDLARAAVEAGYDVSLVTRVGTHGAVVTGAGIRLLPIPMSRRGAGLAAELATILRLWRIYAQERPDLVHHVSLKPIVYGSLAAWLAGVPRVINALTGLGWVFTASQWKARLLRPVMGVALRFLLGRKDSWVIVQNADDRRLLARSFGVPEEKIKLIRGSGVDIRVFSPSPEPRDGDGPPLVVLAARMIWPKGVGEFIEAAAMLGRRGISARFALVGEPDPENPRSVSLSRLTSWRDQGVVEWWGARRDMPEVLRMASVVCLPSSYGEGVPKVLVEAAACGRPIVTTDTPGCREIVRHGVNGLLIPPGDPTALARAVETLLRDPELRRRMGEAGRRLVEEEFSLERVIDLTLDVYREVL